VCRRTSVHGPRHSGGNASFATLRRCFPNINSGTPFTAGELSLDYSLQLQNDIAKRARAGGLQAAPNRTPDANNAVGSASADCGGVLGAVEA
jgi:hypothetical protein